MRYVSVIPIIAAFAAGVVASSDRMAAFAEHRLLQLESGWSGIVVACCIAAAVLAAAGRPWKPAEGSDASSDGRKPSACSAPPVDARTWILSLVGTPDPDKAVLVDQLSEAMLREACWSKDEATGGLLFAVAAYGRTEDPRVFTDLRKAVGSGLIDEYFEKWTARCPSAAVYDVHGTSKVAVVEACIALAGKDVLPIPLWSVAWVGSRDPGLLRAMMESTRTHDVSPQALPLLVAARSGMRSGRPPSSSTFSPAAHLLVSYMDDLDRLRTHQARPA